MITVRIAGPLTKEGADPKVLDRLMPWIQAMIPVANAVKDRVMNHAIVVGDQPHYTKNSGYLVEPTYAQAAGAGLHRYFKSSEDFHQATRSQAGSGKVTGGMWKGYQVRTYGQNEVRVDFAGSSLGREGLARDKGGGASDKHAGKNGRPIKMLNSDKAASLWAGWNINVTQPNQEEMDALHGASIHQLRVAFSMAFNQPVPVPEVSGDPKLFDDIIRSWVTK